MKTKKLIAIYENDNMELLVHIVETIEEASRWIGCGVTTLYDSLHRDGFMNARGYKLELLQLEDVNHG